MVYIRVDMNDIIATGHLMRCVAIADAIRELGDDVIFILADNEAESFLFDRGYKSIILESEWNHMDAELPELLAILNQNPKAKILIDSYQVTEKYLKQVSDVMETTYIDDLNAFVYPVNNLVCYAGYWKKFRHEQIYTKTRLYLGVKYAPLRKEFSACEEKMIKTTPENLLIISGGTDNEDALRKIIRRVDIMRFKQINVICGMYYKFYDCLSMEFSKYENVHIRKKVIDMKSYFDTADLVISAGGTTLYELCACGVPAISYSIADNQLDNVREFDEQKIIAYLGDARFDCIENKVSEVIEEYTFEERKIRSKRMQNYIDGKGAHRIAEILI